MKIKFNILDALNIAAQIGKRIAGKVMEVTSPSSLGGVEVVDREIDDMVDEALDEAKKPIADIIKKKVAKARK